MRTRTLLLLILVLLTSGLTANATDQLRIQDPKSWWRYGQGTIEKSVVSVRPVGIYFVVYRSGAGTQTLKLMMLK